MPSISGQPKTIEDLLRGQDRIEPDSAQAMLVTRLVRAGNQKQKQNRLAGQFTPQERRRPARRDSQETDMSTAINQPSSPDRQASDNEKPDNQTTRQLDNETPDSQTQDTSQPDNETQDNETPDSQTQDSRPDRQPDNTLNDPLQGRTPDNRTPDARQLDNQTKDTRQPDTAPTSPASSDEKQDAEGKKSITAQFREQIGKARQAKQALQEAVAATEAVAYELSADVLRFCWLNVISSFGLTFLVIDLYILLYFIVGKKLLCPPGHEWVPRQIRTASGAAGQKAGSLFAIVEWMLILFLNAILGAVIFGILAIIVMIATWMGESWWGKLTYLWEALWGIGWGGVKELVDLFSS